MYSSIAKNFDKTRSYVWPCVRNFLKVTKEGIFDIKEAELNLLEAGCGNGKNLVYAKELGYIVKGFDVCPELVEICRKKELNVENLDLLEEKEYEKKDEKEEKEEKYNVILCVAVIHHLRDEEERVNSILCLYNKLLPGGKMMFTLWSYETEYNGLISAKEKKMLLGDNIIPWKSKEGKVISNRYYYIYDRKGVENLINKIKKCLYKEEEKEEREEKIKIGWEEQNWIIVISK